MGYSVGDRISDREQELSQSVIAAMLVIRTRISIRDMPPSNLKAYLRGFWVDWRDYYQENKLPGAPDLPEVSPP